MKKNVIIPDAKNLLKFRSLNILAQTIYYSNPENKPALFMDITSNEVKSFLKSLYDYNVEYMLVGGIATVFYGYVRTTQDLDLWVRDTRENKKRLVEALKAINVPAAENYLEVEMIPGWSSLTIGERGFVADFMSYTKAFGKDDFEECYKHAKRTIFEDIPITVIHINHLMIEKKALGRPKDIDDLENLRRINRDREK